MDVQTLRHWEDVPFELGKPIYWQRSISLNFLTLSPMKLFFVVLFYYHYYYLFFMLFPVIYPVVIYC